MVRHAVRQIAQIVAHGAAKQAGPLRLGNLEAVRDWGHAADYCAVYQQMLSKLPQYESPELMSYVVATD